jgi:N-acetylmuramoyl-L-alanine amidase
VRKSATAFINAKREDAAMIVKDHRLCRDDGTPVPFVASPNVGGKVQPLYLIMHFTAGRAAKESVQWLTQKQAKASAHLVIGRDGGVTQLVPFDRVAWHAGKSRWLNLTGLNAYSIGIELDNAGLLKRQGGAWTAWFGDTYDPRDVVEAAHQHETTVRGWHAYTAPQLDAAVEVGLALMKEYAFRDVLGHDDVAPQRKVDPGPAFPMASFRARLLGRADDGERAVFVTTTELNIRTGPGTEHGKLDVSPLPAATPVDLLERSGNWVRVEVLGAVKGQNDIEGWVHGRYLAARD